MNLFFRLLIVWVQTEISLRLFGVFSSFLFLLKGGNTSLFTDIDFSFLLVLVPSQFLYLFALMTDDSVVRFLAFFCFIFSIPYFISFPVYEFFIRRIILQKLNSRRMLLVDGIAYFGIIFISIFLVGIFYIGRPLRDWIALLVTSSIGAVFVLIATVYFRKFLIRFFKFKG